MARKAKASGFQHVDIRVKDFKKSKVFLKRVLSKLPLQTSYFAEGTFKKNELYTSSPYTVDYKIIDPRISGVKIYSDFIDSAHGTITYSFNNKKEQEHTFISNK